MAHPTFVRSNRIPSSTPLLPPPTPIDGASSQIIRYINVCQWCLFAFVLAKSASPTLKHTFHQWDRARGRKEKKTKFAKIMDLRVPPFPFPFANVYLFTRSLLSACVDGNAGHGTYFQTHASSLLFTACPFYDYSPLLHREIQGIEHGKGTVLLVRVAIL